MLAATSLPSDAEAAVSSGLLGSRGAVGIAALLCR